MTGFALRRLALAFPVLLGVSALVFLVISLIPGDPALAILGQTVQKHGYPLAIRQIGLRCDFPRYQQFRRQSHFR